jgi:hypothetical protein
MKNKRSYININFLHIIFSAVAIVVFLMLGSFWNHFRTQQKLSKLESHVERVYRAHEAGFATTIKTNTRVSYASFLNEVNLPEKGIYYINILIKDDKGAYKVQDRYSELSLTLEEMNTLNTILSEDQTTSTDHNFNFKTYSSGNSLFAFTPIKDNGALIGYVVLSVRKNQNI